MKPGPPIEPPAGQASLTEIAGVFLKLGTVGFGGPAAHISMMEDEIVRRRKWVSHDHFLDLLGATNLIPGPNSTEMAIHIGLARAGWRGLVVAGACFILPAVAITLVLARLYVAYGALPQLVSCIVGIRAAVIAVILGAVVRLGKAAVKSHLMTVVGLLVAGLSLAGVDELMLLLAGGIAGVVWDNRRTLLGNIMSGALVAGIPLVQFAGGVPPSLSGPTLTGLGLFFLKIGAILYGSGYVLVAFIQGGLVESNHWLSQTQLLDAIAIGQFTPGPVLSTATFIGFLLLGYPGAAVSTVGIFLPSFVLVLITAPIIPKLRGSAYARGFLDGVNAASIGLMIAVCVMLGKSTLSGIGPWIILISASVTLFRWNVRAAWAALGGALAGGLFGILHVL